MDDKLLNVLVIEDNEDDYKLLLRALSKESILVDAQRVDTFESLENALKDNRWDIVISDNNVPDRRINAKSSLELSRSVNPNIPFIIVSGTIGEENAVKLMKLGVNDYILKDSLTRLGAALKREVVEADSRLKKQEAEKKLTESEERYRMLAESIKDMFFAMDKDLVCTFWNNAAEKMTKLTSADVVGKHLFQILPQANQSPLRETILESIQTMESNTVEIGQPISNPNRFYQVTIYPSQELHTVMVKDITEAKRSARKLKAVNDELETFIYRVSHDVRGPLASMQGIIYLAQNEKFPVLAEDFFARIGRSAARLEDVILSLKEIVKIKQEDVELNKTSITELWEQVKNSISRDAIEFQIDRQIPIEEDVVVTDARLLLLALEKITANATVFVHPARKPVLLFQFKRTSDYFQIKLSDNGAGIQPDLIDKIFKMFYRGSDQSIGPGLGLYLASSAIDKLGGSIYAKSVLNEGSAFTIRLPFSSNN